MTMSRLHDHGVMAAVVAVLFVASAALADDAVLVSITGPLVGRVGERVSFEVELVNRSGRPLQKLRVIDYFDKGFHHDASASPIEQKGTIDLMPGTARRLTLDFLLDEPGRQCHRVEILDPSHVFVGGATHCVEVEATANATAPRVVAPVVPQPPLAAASGQVPPLAAAALAMVATAPQPVPVPSPAAVELDLQGPAEATSDGVVSYVATVHNKGGAASTPCTLEFSWDELLSPVEASDGYHLVASKVTWELAAIEAGGHLKRQINLRAKAPAGAYRDSPPTRSCVRAVLTGLTGGGMLADESCLGISATLPRPRLRTPSELGLKMSLADLDDPVRPGDATTLVCTVTNGGTEPTGRLDLIVILPDQARLDSDRTAARVRIDDTRITFDPLQPIPAGGQKSFEISYRMPVGGTGRATAVLSSTELDGSIERNCQTVFLEP